MKHYSLLILFIFSMMAINVSAQDERDEMPRLRMDDGLGILHADSIYLINFRFRMQNRAEFFSSSATDLTLGELDARVRRLRLRIDGFLGNPKFAYYIQLSFSRGDQDFDQTRVPNIVRDAMFYYFVSPEFYLGFGQGKLPGNRQRVISSGQQQFAERSIVNAYFNIDRDFGLFLYHHKTIGPSAYALKGAITTGEGRNQTLTNDGLAYTARVEFLPFGQFLKFGDYSEGDLERHPTPKVSIGLSYQYNARAQRSRGQTGEFLYEERDMTSFISDFLLKYQGFSLSAEYLNRKSNQPLTYEVRQSILMMNEFNYVFAGEGFNVQSSYLFINNYEVAARYSIVRFDDEIKTFEPMQEMVSLGMTKYLRAHRVKIQSNVSYHIRENQYSLSQIGNRWSWMFQMEIGI